MNKRKYIDFKLYVSRVPDVQETIQVALLPTPEVGETITPVTVAFQENAINDDLAYLASKSITLRSLVALGKQLGNWLLPEGTIRSLFTEARKRVGNEGGIRLRLIIADHGLKQLPWEYIYFDPMGGADSMRGFLALDPRVSIVRHEPLPRPHPHVTASGRTDLRMVMATASPSDQPGLNMDKEVEAITGALKDFHVGGIGIKIDSVLRDATAPDVAAALRGAESTQLFHFAGHGITEIKTDPFTRGAEREEGFLYFIGDKTTKKAQKIPADDLAKYLQLAGVWLVTLGACYSGARSERNPWDSVAGALVARDIPAVVAMQYEIIDTQAIKFNQAFYSALAGSLSLDEAVTLGRLAIYEETSADIGKVVNVEWGVPVLYSRLPDGILVLERETEIASQMRNVIQQTVDTIEEQGMVIGIQGSFVDGNWTVKQKAGTVSGTMIGIEKKRNDRGAARCLG